MLNSLKHKNLGITLLEVLLSVIVITTLIFAATRYYTTARENAKVMQAVSVINNIANASYTWVEGQPNFEGFGLNGLEILINAKLLPDNYKNSDDGTSNNANPWKGSIDVSGSGTIAPFSSTLKIILYNVPKNACKALNQKISNVGGDTKANGCDKATNNFTVLFAEN